MSLLRALLKGDRLKWRGRAALCQGSPWDSLTPELPSSIPDPSARPALHPLVTTLTRRRPEPEHQESLWLTVRTRGLGRTLTSQEARRKGPELEWGPGLARSREPSAGVSSPHRIQPGSYLPCVPRPTTRMNVPDLSRLLSILTLANTFRQSPSWQSHFLAQNP